MRKRLLLALLIALAPSAWSQDPAYSFDRIDLEAAEGEFDLSGRIHRLVGSANVVLYSNEPGAPTLRLRAARMEFTYPATGAQPNSIVLTGNVVIEHPEVTVVAGRADWDLARNSMVFSQNPVVRYADLPGEMRGESIEFDLGTGAVKGKGLVGRDIQLQPTAAEAPATPGLLTVGDVDWPRLLAALKADMEAPQPSPGKRVSALLDGNMRRFLETSTVDQLDANRDAVLRQINRVLQRADLYDSDAWAGRETNAEAQGLLDRGVDALSDAEVVRLNRRLLEAAYPDAVAPLP